MKNFVNLFCEGMDENYFQQHQQTAWIIIYEYVLDFFVFYLFLNRI